MRLKTDIYNALVTNLGKEHINNSPEGQKKVDVLANDLRDAIVKWIQAQTFNITEMEAPIHFPATTIKTQVGGGSVVGPPSPGGGLLPASATLAPLSAAGQNGKSIKNIAQISDTINKINDGRVKSAVRKSKVKLLTTTELT